jgi:hypothetical protein
VVVFVKSPEVPVMVTVAGPATAVLETVSVKVLVLVAGLGLKEAVTPVGKPVADKVTLPLKPFTGETVMVLEPLPPCAIVTLFGDAESAKLGGGATAVTVRESVVVFVKLPDWPDMVTVVAPVVAVPLAVSVKMLVLVAGSGLKVAVTPVGKPAADKVTLPLKPFSGETVIVLEPLAPCGIVKPFGEAERVKFGGVTALTVREIVVLFVKLPEVPVMVTVAGPATAVLLADSVNVLVLVAGLGLKVAVTPVGKPVADKVTLPLKPFSGETVIVLEPLAPCGIVKPFGVAERVKFGGVTAVTVREIVVLFVKLPEVPVMVTVAGPATAVLLADRVNVLVLAAGLGLKVAVTPFGRPDTEKLTLPVKPFSAATVIVLVPLAPCAIVTLAGEAESEKLGPEDGQLFTRLAALTLPIPEAKSQPVVAS